MMHPLAIPFLILAVIVGFAFVQTIENVSFSLPGFSSPFRGAQTSREAGQGELPGSQEPAALSGSSSQDSVPSSPPGEQAPAEEGPPAYLEWITVASVRERDPYLITLRTNIPEGQTVNLTGWTIEGRTESYTVPQGVELVPAGLQGTVFTPIILRRGDQVKISGAANPFKPKFNYRVNECFAYLKQETSFPISVSSSCPADLPEREDVSHLTPSCQDFVLDFRRCEEPPEYPKTSTFANDLQCRTFYENLEFDLSYGGCVANHKAEESFFENEWHLYPNEDDRLVRSSHDRLLLKDPQGRVIDEFVY